MSIGFAFLFTPLFTVSLSSVKPSLYSHGSAVIGTIQQVAGAAGVALFVALMSARAATLAAHGRRALDALSGGVRAGFLCGAVISLIAVACVFFVRRPSAGRRPGIDAEWPRRSLDSRADQAGTCSLAEVLAVHYGHHSQGALSTHLTADEIIHITCDE